ncbi:alkaline phosphatase PhoX [Flavobacterium sp. GCM10027622]|uniref:alkaline phosphatase PhoX n=1 Tax=unclassified Flavobacterium TaxID=196869 RepID=UPI0036096708
MKISKVLLSSALLGSFIACNSDEDKAPNPVELKNHSKTPVFISKKSGFEKLEIYSLLSSEDKLSGFPEFVYGSMADGNGLLKNSDGTYSLLNNIEAHYSVARITFDKTFKPVKGEYVLNAAGTANTAMCSGTMVTPEEHGFGPLFLSGGEWDGNSKNVFATDPFKNTTEAGTGKTLPALGQWDVENAVPLGKDAYSNKTVVLIGDDYADNFTPKGQLAMYVGNRGDLDNGKLYGLKVNNSAIHFEMDMVEGTSYDISFVEYNEKTYNEIEAESAAKGIMGFSRVEDIDYRKGSPENNREFYFAVTGRKKTDLIGKGTVYGRIYKVILDANNPLSGKITCVLDGDKLTGKAKQFHSPDNVVATKDYLYIMEDPNGYPDTADKTHNAYLYQYNLKTGALKVVLECDQTMAESKGYGNTSTSWEFTGMVDVSDKIGIDGSFLIITQNHGWNNNSFFDPKAVTSTTYKEGSTLYLIKGLER